MTALGAPVAFPALGTTATLLVTDAAARHQAEQILRRHLDAIDGACSRFRDDSELGSVNANAGRPVAVSALFLEAVEVALRAARLTGGRVDPTVGSALRLAGYDRDFGTIDRDGPAVTVTARPVPGWTRVRADRAALTVNVPAGVELDLGATAKALCADRASADAAEVTGAGVLVSLGGDIATAGPPPPGGWRVRVADDHRAPLEGPGPTVAIGTGGVATSSTSVRRWARGGQDLHHVIDPATGAPATTPWRTATVAAATCVDANIASIAAIILGDAGPAWLAERHLPARLVRIDGQVAAVAGWPEEETSPC